MTSIKPSYPQEFPYYQEIKLRYADLDTLQHINNVAILEFVETSRIGYLQACGIWDGTIRSGFGMVVAAIKIDYVAQIQFSDPVRVGIKLGHLGNKSLRFRFQVENSENKTAYARGEVVMVAYDQTEERSLPITQEWREKLAAFENNQEFLA